MTFNYCEVCGTTVQLAEDVCSGEWVTVCGHTTEDQDDTEEDVYNIDIYYAELNFED